ncbi:hypothetical protein BDV93DRAFT_510223 [Ceratobasidium sp. AG-I]|nr:hypothetical protein BDV93DRAFT_510223 [Ceratobasidium sp. AG-I]
MFENMVPSLIALWTQSKKCIDFGSGRKDYIISWANLDTVGTTCNARMLLRTFLPQPLLHDKLEHAYRQHFLQLVQLINMCLNFKIATEKTQVMHDGFANFKALNSSTITATSARFAPARFQPTPFCTSQCKALGLNTGSSFPF